MHHLIVTHKLTNVVRDRTQVSQIIKVATDDFGMKRMGGRAYFGAPAISASEDAGITLLEPQACTLNAKADK